MQTLLDKDALVFDPPELGTVLSLTGLPGGGSKIYDRSIYGNHGTITGATWKRLPSGLVYLDFDGTDDKVVIPHAPSLVFSDAMTAILWYKHPTADGTGWNDNILDKGIHTGTNPAFALTMRGNSDGANINKLWFRVKDGGATNTIVSTNTFNDDTWHFVVTMWEDSTNFIGMYVDDIEEKTGATTVASLADTADLHMGFTDQSNYPANAAIARFRLLNRRLSLLECAIIRDREKHLFGVW